MAIRGQFKLLFPSDRPLDISLRNCSLFYESVRQYRGNPAMEEI